MTDREGVLPDVKRGRSGEDGGRRAQIAVLAFAVTTFLAVAFASSTAALKPPPRPLNAVVGQMIVAPQDDAFVTQLPVKATIRMPAGATGLAVTLHGHKVTGRFHSAGKGLRVATLRRTDGMAWGSNELLVIAKRRGRKPLLQARSFYVARRANLVRLTVRPGPVTSVDVRLDVPSGALAKRASVLRQNPTFHLWLNGRSVTRAFDEPQVTHWTASLSATQGLHYGVNQLRLVVDEPDTGRDSVLRRSFAVARTHDLASAGWDIETRLGERVDLSGHGSHTLNGTRPVFRWRILSRPRGSHAKLQRSGAERPEFTPDRIGDYKVGLTVTSAGKRGTASASATEEGEDLAVVSVAPSRLLLPFHGLTHQNGKPGIQIGGTFYANPSPAGHTYMQWLTLDRVTLTPVGNGNSYFDGSTPGHDMSALQAAVNRGDVDDLVILSFPYGGSDPPVQKTQVDAFNKAMAMIGVGPIDPPLLTDPGQKLVVVGVPFGGDQSGQYIHGGAAIDGLAGWLMPDGPRAPDRSLRYRLVPERPTFNTSSASTATSNTMTIGGKSFQDTLPPDSSGGFQVAILNPTDFTVDDHRVFPTNATVAEGHPVSGREDMIKFLKAHENCCEDIVIQSIGHVQAAAPFQGGDQFTQRIAENWLTLTKLLPHWGVNPDIFNRANGSYAFIGGPLLARSDDADSSSQIMLNTSRRNPISESGHLNGRASMRPDGTFTFSADTVGTFNNALYDIVFRSPTPWPLTRAELGTDAAEAPAYQKALAYITEKLPQFKGYGADLRQAYTDNLNIDYAAAKVDLARLPYPGDEHHTCQPPKPETHPSPGFDHRQFCRLSNELQDEFGWLSSVDRLFSAYEKALARSGGQQQADLLSIGEEIRKSIKPDTDLELAYSIARFLGNLLSAGLLLDPATAPIRAVWQAFLSIVDLAQAVHGDASGPPLGDQVKSKVQDLASQVANRLAGTANGLDRLHQVIASDYGRLRALGSEADSPRWRVDIPDVTSKLTLGAKAFFATQLFPIPWNVYALEPATHFPSGLTPDTCNTGSGMVFKGAPPTAYFNWIGDFTRDGYHGLFPTVFVFGPHRLQYHTDAYPPASLTNSIFHTVDRNGYGVQMVRFLWTAYENKASTQDGNTPAPPTDIAVC
jgi:hypothetical protein